VNDRDMDREKKTESMIQRARAEKSKRTRAKDGKRERKQERKRDSESERNKKRGKKK